MTGLAQFAFFMIASVAEVRTPPLPDSMAILGDSLSEAMFSDFSIERPPTQTQLLGILGVAASNPLNIIEEFRKYYAKREHSWSTGDDPLDVVNSHFERLKKLNPKMRAFNFAVSGSETFELDLQVTRLMDLEKSEKILIDHLQVLAGGNDFRKISTDDILDPVEIAGNVEKAIRRILAERSDRSVLILGLPRILKVFEESYDLNAVRTLGRTYTCNQVRRLLYRNSAIFRQEDKVSYAKVKELLDGYDSELALAAERLQKDFPNAYIKTILKYDSGFTQYKKILSVDCFHPSIWGQALIAEETWASGFWPDQKLELEDALMNR